MSFDWVGYLAAARALACGTPQTINRQARLRSALSRSYYAAFIKARNHLRDQNGLVTPTSVNPHQYVINQFLYSRTSIRYRIG